MIENGLQESVELPEGVNGRSALRAEQLERRDLLVAKPVPVFGAPVEVGDVFEPNDDPAAASELGVLGEFSAVGLSIHAADNDDFYRMTMAGTGVLSITANFTHTLGDLDILLLDAGLNLVALSDSVTDVEQIRFGVTAGELYYLLVAGYEGALNTYDLVIDGPDILVADRFEPNDDAASATDLGELGRRVETALTIHEGNNDDYYRFTTEAAGELNVSIDFAGMRGDVELQLLDAVSNVVAASETTDDIETLTATVTVGETYYVRVFGFSGTTNPDYRLVIDAPIGRGNVAGTVWNDADGDGVRDEGEAGLQSQIVFVDSNLNGVKDFEINDSSNFAAQDLPLAINDRATAVSTITVTGIDLPIRQVVLQLSLEHTWLSDLTGRLVSPSGTSVELFSNVGQDGDDMPELQFVDGSTTRIATAVAPISGTFRPLRPLSTFDGESANGEWRLEIDDGVDGDTGMLNFWMLDVTGESNVEPQATTNADGEYEFTDLPAGSHTIVQVLPADTEITYPSPTTTHTVTVVAGDTISGVDFGNHSAPGTDARVIDVRLGRSTGATARYSIPVGNSAQLDPIAMVGVDQISVVFDRAWDVGANSLELLGVNTESYELSDAAFTTVPGDGGTLVATWTLATPLKADKLLAIVRAPLGGDVTLDGDWTNPIVGGTGSNFPSGDGVSGGDFEFRFNVLAGDANRDGSVDRGDVAHLMRHGFVSAMDAGYDARHDLNGNGIINVVDAVMAANCFGASLPEEHPSGSPVAASVPLAAGAVVQRAEERSRRAEAVVQGGRWHSRGGESVDPGLVDRTFNDAASIGTLGLRASRVRRAALAR